MSQTRNPAKDLKQTAEDILSFIESYEKRKKLEEAFKKAKENEEYYKQGLLGKASYYLSKPAPVELKSFVEDEVKKALADSEWTATSLNTLLVREIIKVLPGYDAKASVSLEQIQLINDHIKIKKSIEEATLESNRKIASNAQALASYFYRDDLTQSEIGGALTYIKDHRLTKLQQAKKAEEIQQVEEANTVTQVLKQFSQQPKPSMAAAIQNARQVKESNAELEVVKAHRADACEQQNIEALVNAVEENPEFFAAEIPVAKIPLPLPGNVQDTYADAFNHLTTFRFKSPAKVAAERAAVKHEQMNERKVSNSRA